MGRNVLIFLLGRFKTENAKCHNMTDNAHKTSDSGKIASLPFSSESDMLLHLYEEHFIYTLYTVGF
jgi:hypothetical protein